jgi:hypothetical protein
MPDELDLEEHDALDVRGARASRNGRKSSRDFVTDDDSFGGGRSRRNTARRDEGKEQRRREAGSREEPPFHTRPPMSPAAGFQRSRDAAPPYASGGSRIAERPRSPYPDRFDRGPARPTSNPAYGSNPNGNRAPSFRPSTPMSNSQPPRPPMTGRDGQDMRDNRPYVPRFARSDSRPAASPQARPQQGDTRGGYGNGPARSSVPGNSVPSGTRPPFRRPDGPPPRPFTPRDDPRRVRREDTDQTPSRP